MILHILFLCGIIELKKKTYVLLGGVIMSIFDIDWNNDGTVDYKDTVIDSLILDELEEDDKKSFDFYDEDEFDDDEF